VVGLAAVLGAAAMVPLGGVPAPCRFEGDLIVVAYLLGLLRFFTVVAALDTGSSFEGMGASREVTFAALAEPALFLGLAAVARYTGTLSLSSMFAGITAASWAHAGPAFALLTAAFLVVFLAENARIPVDDPTTHLELTMIHEVMVLDHSGPDLAFILYGASLKLFLFGALVVRLTLGFHFQSPWLALLAFLGGMLAFAALVGAVESTMARLRLPRVPQMLVGASVLSVFALVLLLR
jgi:formate hydrogenlyase subunit 4